MRPEMVAPAARVNAAAWPVPVATNNASARFAAYPRCFIAPPSARPQHNKHLNSKALGSRVLEGSPKDSLRAAPGPGAFVEPGGVAAGIAARKRSRREWIGGIEIPARKVLFCDYNGRGRKGTARLGRRRPSEMIRRGPWLALGGGVGSAGAHGGGGRGGGG